MARLGQSETPHFACVPCRSGAHDECDKSAERPCSCLVCEAAVIGEQVMGDGLKRRLR